MGTGIRREERIATETALRVRFGREPSRMTERTWYVPGVGVYGLRKGEIRPIEAQEVKRRSRTSETVKRQYAEGRRKKGERTVDHYTHGAAGTARTDTESPVIEPFTAWGTARQAQEAFEEERETARAAGVYLSPETMPDEAGGRSEEDDE